MSGHDINLLYCNIRSIRKNFDKLKLYLYHATIEYHIIVLAETWISENELPLFHIDNFTGIIQRRYHKRSGGVAIYVNSNIKFNVIKKYASILHESILIEVHVRDEKLKILASYRNCKSSMAKYTEFLNNMQEKFDVLVGDINQDIYPGNITHADSLEYLNVMESKGFKSIVNEVTRETGKTATCIDHCHVKRMLNAETQILDIGISDHKCISVSFKKIAPVSRPLCYTFCDVRIVKARLSCTDWSELFNCQDVDVAYSILVKNINVAKEAATETIIITNRNRRRREWITQPLIDKCRRKNKLYKLCKKHPFSIRLKLELDNICRELKYDIKRAKTTFCKEKYNNAKTTKEFWDVTNFFMKRRTANVMKPIALELNDNKKIEVDGNEKIAANYMNSYFVGIADKLLTENNIDINSKTNVECNGCATSMYFGHVTSDVVERALDNMHSKKSSGTDGISSEHLKLCKNELLPALVYFCNLSFSYTTYPKGLKESIVIPIYKNGNPELAENYRPIYLNCTIGKLLETIVQGRIMKYLETINFLSPNQYGFRPKISTELTLREYTKSILEGLENEKKVAACHIDLRKCFDIVNRCILLKKLEKIGICGRLLNWMVSYFQHRTQCTRIRNVTSDSLPLEHGILQGSSLAPLMFLIFINDACNLHMKSKLILFADDAAIICTSDSYEDLYKNLTNDVTKFMAWVQNHKLIPNFKKTNIIEYTYNRSDTNPFRNTPVKIRLCALCTNTNICNHHKEILHVDSVKYLGLDFDRYLTWNITLTNLHKRLRTINNLFYVMKNFMPTSAMVKIYIALYQSRLQYGITLWGSASQVWLRPIIISQKFIVRSISKCHRLHHTTELFKQLNILPVSLLHKKVTLQLFISQMLPKILLPNRERSTRQNALGCLTLPKYKKVHTGSSFLCKSYSLYNEYIVKYRPSLAKKDKKNYVKIFIDDLLQLLT